MRWRFVMLFLLAACRSDAEPTHEASFPFEFRDGFIWVQVVVPGASEPLQMLLDSGAEVSTLNSATAERLGVKGGRRVTVLGVDSKGIGRWPVRLEAKVGDIAVPGQFLVADLCEVQKSCQCPVDGLLGADFFWQKIVEIDFKRERVRMLESGPEEGQRIPIRFRGKIMQVSAEVSGKEQWVRLDTGCASAMEWVSQGQRKGSERMSIGLAELHSPTARQTVRLGEKCLENVSVGIHGRPFFASEGGLLGLGLLRRFEQITIDGERRQLVLSGSKR